MKYLAFTAALMIGGSAMAQEAMQAPTEETTGQESMMTEDAPATATDNSMMNDPATASQGSMGAQAPMSSSMQSNGTPERAARGIPVVSDMANAPSGANQPVPGGGQVVPASNQSAVFATQPSTKTYQACTRTVTDGCVQAYERGSRTPR